MKLILFCLLALVCFSLWAAEGQKTEIEQFSLDQIPFDDNHVPPGLEERLYSEQQASYLRAGLPLAPEANEVLPEKNEIPLPQSLSK